MRKAVKILSIVGLSFLAGEVMAAELSLLTGLYRKEEKDVGGVDAGGKSTINLGGRYSDLLDSYLHWYGQGELFLRSYDAASGGVAPSDSTSLVLGGGVRYYFAKLTESTSTFMSGGGFYRSEKDASILGGADYIETERSGLYYGASLGLRINVDPDFFFDFEAPIFESALFATETETRVTVAGGTRTEVKAESEKMELYAASVSPFSAITIGFGARL